MRNILLGFVAAVILTAGGSVLALGGVLSSSDTQNTERSRVNDLITLATNWSTTTANTWTQTQTFANIIVSSCTGCGGGVPGDPFTHGSYNSQVTSATSTLLWLTGSSISLAASSSVLTYASSTALTATNLYGGTLVLTNDLTVANGGTGLSTFGGSNTVLYTSAADTLTSSANLTFDGTRLTMINGTSTNFSASQSLFVNSKRVTGTRYPVISRATSTTWTGTTTADQMIMRFSGTLDDAICKTTSGFLRTQVYVNSTAVAPMFHASSTGGKITFSANNSFVAGDTLQFDFGTSSASINKIMCSGTISVTSD